MQAATSSMPGVCCKYDNSVNIGLSLRLLFDCACYIWLWLSLVITLGGGIGTAIFAAISFLSVFGLSNFFLMVFSSGESCCNCILCNCCCKDCCVDNKSKQGGAVFFLILRLIALIYTFEFVSVFEAMPSSDFQSGDDSVNGSVNTTVDDLVSTLKSCMYFLAFLQICGMGAISFWWYALCNSADVPMAAAVQAPPAVMQNPALQQGQPVNPSVQKVAY